MADITKCANWHNCPRHATCARCPEEKEKKYFFGETFHPDAPWLCFKNKPGCPGERMR